MNQVKSMGLSFDFSPYLKRESKVFATSDTHFGHKKIIEYCDRPFADIWEMQEKLIENWNSVVGSNDVVIHLGDVFLGIPKFVQKQIVSQLNGTIFLIPGNHDNEKKAIYEELGFIVLDNKIPNTKKYAALWYEDMLLSHYPLLPDDELWQTVRFNVHGHTHNTPMEKPDSRLYNACVEMNSYRPVKLSEVYDYLRAQNYGGL